MRSLMHHPAEESLHRLVDGELDAEEAAAVERHAAGCPSCGELLARLEHLQRTVARTPRAVAPPAHLWSGVRQRLDAARGLAATRGDTGEGEPASGVRHGVAADRAIVPRPARRAWWAAAAAAALVLAAVGIERARDPLATGRGLAGSGRAGVGAPLAQAAEGPAATVGANGDAFVQLMRDLEDRRHILAPETVAVVEQNLRTIEAAIAATQRALAADPNNVHLERMLERSRRQQAEYIRSALAIASESGP